MLYNNYNITFICCPRFYLCRRRGRTRILCAPGTHKRKPRVDSRAVIKGLWAFLGRGGGWGGSTLSLPSFPSAPIGTEGAPKRISAQEPSHQNDTRFPRVMPAAMREGTSGLSSSRGQQGASSEDDPESNVAPLTGDLFAPQIFSRGNFAQGLPTTTHTQPLLGGDV